MKKLFALMLILPLLTYCGKEDEKTPEPDPDPKPEEVVPVEGDSEWSVVGTLLESNWGNDPGKDYVMAKSGDIYVLKNVQLVADDEIKIRKDKAWGENRGGDFVELGKGFEVVNNGNNIKVGAEGVYDIYYNAAKEQMAVCAKGATPTWSDPAPAASITIDGNFDDWAAVDQSKIAKTFCAGEDAKHPALKKAYVYADAEYINVYFEWDTDLISASLPTGVDENGDEIGSEYVPFHVYLNTDGDATTGGFADQFADACIDVLFEGFIYDVNEAGELIIGSYDPWAFAWAGDANGSGWSWSDLGGPVCEGAGVEGKYEFSIERKSLADLGKPVADVFSIGFDIQQAWDSVGVLPEELASETNPSGIKASLQVTTVK